MSAHVDVAIIGGGCVGASIFSELALRDITNVALIDRGRRTTSATASSGGMYRVFHENPEHVALALEHQARLTDYAERGWLRLPETTNGCVYFFHRERYAGYSGSIRRMQAAGYPFEVVDAAHGHACFPQFYWAKTDAAIYEPQAGQMSASAFTDDVIALGTRRGLSVHDDVDVTSVERRHGLYHLTTTGPTIIARAVVFAGGARMLPFIASLASGLEVRALSTFIAARADGLIPNYFDRESLEHGGFGLPKQATLSSREPRRLRPELCGAIIGVATARDCYSSDRLGVHDVPGHPGMVIATGWGGTAFKLALGIGNRVSRRLAHHLDRRTPHVSAS